MNYSLQYYPDPGIAFDITKMLFVKLTPENIWKPMLTSFETSTQDFTYIQQRSEYFPVPKPELLLFSFSFRPKKMMFLTDVILKLFNKGFSSFSISQLLSYFDDVAQQAVIDRFWNAMAPKSYLYIGHSESLFGMKTQFEFLKTDWACLYQKNI